jgi:RNA polymerase sigma factor (sigma-70 family)
MIDSPGPRVILAGMEALALHFKRLKRLLLRYGRSGDDAEDLIQEAFLRMQAYCERGGKVREPEAFLARTVVRLSINARRDEHAELYSGERVEDLKSLVDTSPSPHEVVAADECLRRMRVTLDEVSRKAREAFFMHRLDGMSYAQIAAEMGCSVSSIDKYIARAMAAIGHESDWGRE